MEYPVVFLHEPKLRTMSYNCLCKSCSQYVYFAQVCFPEFLRGVLSYFTPDIYYQTVQSLLVLK